MKRALIFTLAAALPLAAGEQKKEQTAKTAEPASTATASAAAPAQPDSPLVAAMKRANRKGKKPTNLITNATLSRAGGSAHITTTDNPQGTINLPAPATPPRPTPEMVAARTAEIQKKQLAEIAEKERKAKEEQKRKQAQAAAAYEDGYDGVQDDGAEFVGTAPPPPQE